MGTWCQKMVNVRSASRSSLWLRSAKRRSPPPRGRRFCRQPWLAPGDEGRDVNAELLGQVAREQAGVPQYQRRQRTGLPEPYDQLV